MRPYQVRQLDTDGQVVSEEHVTADNYRAALRQLGEIVDGARRIEVYNDEGEKVGETSVDYWRLKGRSRM